MFELPELTVIAAQMNEVLPGLTVAAGTLGNSPHKFVWYDREPEEFAALTAGLRAGPAWAEGKWLFLPLEPGCVLLLGEWGGRIRYHARGEALPAKRHLDLTFTTGAAFSATTQMWGGVHLCEAGREHDVKYVKGMRPTPVDDEFDRRYFDELVAVAQRGGKRSVKGLLTQDQLIPGLGNAIAQDIMFRARLHPRHALAEVSEGQLDDLFAAITGTVRDVIAAGGRGDERDLFGRRGGYARLMDAKAAGRPCPACGMPVTKISYLGGACYVCAACQR
ncbi:MAG: DNA-formamidopyrimidine glycosylase family protein [Deltaproteobacteria bacterium]